MQKMWPLFYLLEFEAFEEIRTIFKLLNNNNKEENAMKDGQMEL
jgi:hypothetical protein